MNISDNFAGLLFYIHTYGGQTSSVSPRASDPVQILPGPGWFSGSRTSMERLTQKKKYTKKEDLNEFSENSFYGILNIFYRSGPRAPDSVTSVSDLGSGYGSGDLGPNL